MHGVVLDDTVHAVLDDKRVVRAEVASPVIVSACPHGVCADDATRAMAHPDMGAQRGILKGGVACRCSASAEDVAGDGCRLHMGITAEIQRGSETSVKEVARDVITVAARQNKSPAAVPFHTVAGAGNGGHYVSAQNTAVLIAGKPVVQNESVPTVDEKPRAPVAVQHGMAHRKAPDMRKMQAVAGKMADPAVIDRGGIFLASAVVFFPIKLDAVYVFAYVLTVQAHTSYGTAKGTADVQHAVGIFVMQAKDTRTVAAEAPRRSPHQRYALTAHFQRADHIPPRRDDHAPLTFSCRVQSGLYRPGAILLSVADRAEICNIKLTQHTFSSIGISHYMESVTRNRGFVKRVRHRNPHFVRMRSSPGALDEMKSASHNPAKRFHALQVDFFRRRRIPLKKALAKRSAFCSVYV